MISQLPPLDARIPKWNLEDLIERSCPICNSPDANTTYKRPDGLNVQRCNICSTFFVSPSPSGEQLQAFYRSYDEKHRRAPTISTKELVASYETANPYNDLRIKELSTLMKFDGSTVLEIGFGRAFFLYLLKRLGAVPYGLELDPQAIELANSLGIESVFHADLTSFVSETKFDLIAMLDLIEHPLNPMEMLRESSELMQRGGFLIIWTPNGDFGGLCKNTTTFRVDLEHMQYLTPETCIFIASKLKLRIAHLETVGFPYLEDIDRAFSKDETFARRLKRMAKSIPGFSTINSFRHKMSMSSGQDERTGAYHLFCIMQKPA